MSDQSIDHTQRREATRLRNLVLRGGIWWVSKMIRGTEHRFSTKTGNLEEAKHVLSEFLFQINSKKDIKEVAKEQRNMNTQFVDAWSLHVAEMIDNKASWFWRTLYQFDTRMAKKGIEDGRMSKEHLARMLIETGGKCSATGIAFEFGPGHEHSPFRCSVDRIDPRHGYTEDNCRAVCLCVNYARNKWGDEVLLKMAQGVLLNHLNSSGNASHALSDSVSVSDLYHKLAKRSTKRRKRAARSATASRSPIRSSGG